jgi:hypothetical protein
MLKYSYSTLPCNPRSARKQEELQVQHDGIIPYEMGLKYLDEVILNTEPVPEQLLAVRAITSPIKPG